MSADEQRLVLVRATEGQYIQSLANQLEEWGGGLSLEKFIEREKLTGKTGLGKTLQCWVLVHANETETIEFLCSVETFRRPILYSSSESSIPQRSIAYSIASVFTPPSNRSKGYANKMMTLLHSKLRTDGKRDAMKAGEEVTIPWEGGEDGLLSFLYSDVGNFYARCGQPGWNIEGTTTTTWLVSAFPSSLSSSVPVEIESTSAIKLSDLADIANNDFNLLLHSLAMPNLSHLRTKTAFLVEPTFGAFEWATTRSTHWYSAHDLSPPKTWGIQLNAHDTRTWSFLLFTVEPKKKTLKVLRLRVADKRHFPHLLHDTIKQAKDLGMEKIVGWNVKEEWREMMEERQKGGTKERLDSLSAIAWYGGAEQAKWLNNEGYAWC